MELVTVLTFFISSLNLAAITLMLAMVSQLIRTLDKLSETLAAACRMIDLIDLRVKEK